jgi:FixJ family two-component response regulator
MNVTPEEAERLLREVKNATARTEAALRAIELDAARRRVEARKFRQAAVLAAMEAGIPRKRIAEAGGVTTARLYQIAEGTR